jgi:hypothetical protein
MYNRGLFTSEAVMINLETVELELAQARAARIETQLIGCEIEELADNLRQTNAAWPLTQQAARRGPSPHLFVFSP